MPIKYRIGVTEFQPEGCEQVCYAVLSHRPETDLPAALKGHSWIFTVKEIPGSPAIFEVRTSPAAEGDDCTLQQAIFDELRRVLKWPDNTEFIPDFKRPVKLG